MKVFCFNMDSDQKYERMHLSVSKLLMLGILYCASNYKQRANKFYELVVIGEDDGVLKEGNGGLEEIVGVIGEISTVFALKVYNLKVDYFNKNSYVLSINYPEIRNHQWDELNLNFIVGADASDLEEKAIEFS